MTANGGPKDGGRKDRGPKDGGRKGDSSGPKGASRASEKIRAQRAAQAQAQRRRRRYWLAGTGTVIAAAAVAVSLVLTSGGGATSGAGGTTSLNLAALSTLGTLRPAPSPGSTGPEGVPVPDSPVLAGTAAITTGQDIDGIGCQSSEQTVFHIHAHLTVFVNGQPRQVPAGIGIPDAQATSTPNGSFVDSGSCFYWLHTHAADGIIHIESPVQRTYTLGEFFDEWGQPLSANQAGPAKGHVTVIYNGKVYRGDPRDVPLTAHAQIQLEVGTPLIAPLSITFPNGL